jgi:hypothetical protein
VSVAEIGFRVVRASAVEHSASPELALTVEVSLPGASVDCILLRSSVRIEAGRRSHDEAERERLRELFGGESLWARSSKSLLWSRATSVVPGFDGATSVDIALPCSYDLAASAFRYLHGVGEGDVPITVQFSGTLFFRSEGVLQVTQIPWDREAPFRVPVDLFRTAIDAHFPNAAVLGLGRAVFERLDGYRRKRGMRSMDEAIERLLGSEAEGETGGAA